jgi:hypothetical protein
MDVAGFKVSLKSAAPPDCAVPLQALWWAAKGDWAKAHDLAQEEDTKDGAWVHAYLHRVEGDLPNASYWYRRAARPTATGSLDAEWTAIVQALL